MIARWRLRPHDPSRIAALARGAGLHELLAQLLLNRGIAEPQAARAFLDVRRDGLHDPESLPGIAEAADRITRAVRDGRRIVIYGDYDVDGVCGTSILWACLRLAGGRDVAYYIPHRVDEGYGLNADALRRLAEDGAGLVVTVDCGITAVHEAQLARELGLELIITDHHTFGRELPEADVVVHPRRPGSTYPFGDLCGCGVAFKLAWQLCKSFGDGKKASPHLREFLVNAMALVALATVADVVPIGGENRIFVRHGLSGMRARPSVGLRALMEVAGVLGKSRLSTGNLGFGLAPRINAAGRLECAQRAVELLTTDDEAAARDLALWLDEHNRKRQEIERTIVAEAREIVDAAGDPAGRGAIVVGREGWHPGVIGIVAGRLAEHYHRPTVVVALADGQGQGSARSIPGLDLHAALTACSEGLTAFGGHAAAAGLRLPAGLLPSFAERLDAHCRSALAPEQLQKELLVDAEVPLGVLTPQLVEAIEAMEPHGIGNPNPLLVANDVRVVGEPRVVGERKNHLQVRFAQGNVVAKAIAWNFAPRAGELATGTVCSIAFRPSINEWNGRREVQLELKDVRPAPADRHALPA